MSDTIDCPVELRAGVSKFGIFANAFRVVPEAGQECFLDFCVYSAQEERAEVVSRIRIHRSFMAVLRERLSQAMQELTKEPATYVIRDNLLQTSDGQIVLSKPPDGGGEA